MKTTAVSRAENSGHQTAALKERSVNHISATPRKRSKESQVAQIVQPATLPEEEVEPTPACVRCALGPTPQKDGEVLGIFDSLPEATPSKVVGQTQEVSLAVVAGTPSKPMPHTSSEPKPSKTPQSSGKRYYLEAFAGTPLKRKREDELYTPSTTKRQYLTPSFLRRNAPLSRFDEEECEVAATAQPFKKRGLVRSLSSIIQGLKNQEEQRMADEWEIMDELEAERAGENVKPRVPKLLVEDSQSVQMPLGPDAAAGAGDEESDADAGALDVNGNPRKVWKKKGLKRQTRRVIMRPVAHKPRKATGVGPANSDDSESEMEAVEETQLQEGEPARANDDLSGADSEFELENQSGKHDSQQSRHQVKKTKAKPETTKQKKVSAQAHANFRKLKIKNKNSKANGRGKKFGRR